MSNDNEIEKKVEKEQRYYVTLYLKHGHIISFTCTEFKTTTNVFGEYTEVSWKGIDRTLSFSITSLIAHTAERVKDEAQ